MTNSITRESIVRVDFFKPSGKWYTTEYIEMYGYYTAPDLHNAIRACLHNTIGDRYSGMTAVCLEPHHQHAHPVLINWDLSK